MTKFVTYHAYKSTNLGGVESLVRELQRLTADAGFSCVELYRYNVDEVYEEKDFIDYEMVLEGKNGKLGAIIDSRMSIKRLNLGRDDFLFIFNPIYLIYIPFSVLFCSKVVLVQASKLEVVYSKWFVKFLVNFFGRFLHRLTVYGESDFRQLTKMFPELKEKVRVVPRACRLKISEVVQNRSKDLVTIARIDESVKNFSVMIDVMRELGPEYSLDIYGGGKPEEVSKLRELIAKCENVRYRGATSNVADTLRKYSVFLMTSRFEGLGQAAIEARSQGLPVVLFDTFPNASLVVKNGETGFLVKPWSISAYTRAIKDILRDDHTYRAFSHASIIMSKELSSDRIDGLWFSEVLADG